MEYSPKRPIYCIYHSGCNQQGNSGIALAINPIKHNNEFFNVTSSRSNVNRVHDLAILDLGFTKIMGFYIPSSVTDKKQRWLEFKGNCGPQYTDDRRREYGHDK
eukprot:NODE_83_length_22457_cov_0.375794.p16 type:complete len:104 gc:universal NODE_83_length_22457_cov_0.375794:15245-15556(+)